MKISSFPSGALWFDFSDEEMNWDYRLIGGWAWIFSGIWVDSEYVLYEKDLKEIE